MFKQSVALVVALVLVSWTAGFALADVKHYFPTGALDPSSPRSDDFRNAWYSAQLHAMAEPVLVPTNGTITYRFTWLRTFHHPVAIRVTTVGGKAELHAIELDGAGGYSPGKVLRKEERYLKPDESTKLEELIQKSGFWSIPSHEETLGLDGSEWVLEGVADKYHVVARWSPKSGPVRELGEQLLSLSGWHYAPKEFY